MKKKLFVKIGKNFGKNFFLENGYKELDTPFRLYKIINNNKLIIEWNKEQQGWQTELEFDLQ